MCLLEGSLFVLPWQHIIKNSYNIGVCVNGLCHLATGSFPIALYLTPRPKFLFIIGCLWPLWILCWVSVYLWAWFMDFLAAKYSTLHLKTRNLSTACCKCPHAKQYLTSFQLRIGTVFLFYCSWAEQAVRRPWETHANDIQKHFPK